MPRKVFAVVVLRGIEFVQRDNLCHDGLLAQATFVKFLDYFFSDGFLFLVVIEDGRTVLRTGIGALPVP